MGRKPLVVWAGVLALLMSGCDSLPFFGGDQASEPSPTSPTPTTPQGSPIAAGSPMAPPRAGASPGGAIGSVPLAPNVSPGRPAQPSPGVASVPGGLITSTSPEAALRQNPPGRSNPFAPVLVQPVVRVAANNAAANTALIQRPVPSLPQIPAPPRAALPIPPSPSPRPAVVTATAPGGNNGGRPGTTTGSAATAARPGTTTGGTTTAARPGTTGSTPFVPQLPALPEPTLARLVEVSGILDVDGAEPRAIVKAPNEPTSRYVSPGERLSDGLILVKRIEMSGPGGPVVVLEQFGIEVTRRIGDRSPTTPNQTGTPTA